MAKKKAKKPVAIKKAKKPVAAKKEKVIVKPHEKQKRIDELEIKLEKIQLKADDKRKGNKNDKIVADLLEEKAAKYWGQQKEDVEAAE